jgi:hypothetical protein
MHDREDHRVVEEAERRDARSRYGMPTRNHAYRRTPKRRLPSRPSSFLRLPTRQRGAFSKILQDLCQPMQNYLQRNIKV